VGEWGIGALTGMRLRGSGGEGDGGVVGMYDVAVGRLVCCVCCVMRGVLLESVGE
jgi:hypothetical protein